MAVSWLSRLAVRGPATVFPALGMHGEDALYRLARDPGIALVDTPRHAAILLVAGGVPPHLQDALRRVHDQLPAPCATLWYQSEPLLELNQPGAVIIDDPAALPGAVKKTWRRLITREQDTAPRLLPDTPPNPWQGLGDDGHGGEGMMGGVPYGRPMAMPPTPDLRDGLALDVLTFRLGPFFPLWPAGLAAEVALQGDIVQQFAVVSPAFPQAVPQIFVEAQSRPVAIAELERKRVQHHLYAFFHALGLAHLPGLARRALALAEQCDSRPVQALDKAFTAFERALVRRGFFALYLPRGATLEGEDARALGGVAARAAGVEDDARHADDGYRRLGFSPVTQQAGDVPARWRQRLAEIQQSLRLIGRAEQGDAVTAATDSIELPQGTGSAHELLENQLPGLEWSEALATVASLDVAEVSPWPHP
ncbi:hypothetical protein GCM10022228_17590 [Halomonas cibimaris]|uniref:NADH-quinone oxidoreductase subunit D domain-containing protein n=1 Tax=Halomonas cibimaris TaxID=657012 RepID=A0ABP7LUD6_9GAMM